MKYDQVKDLEKEKYRRLTGLKHSTFLKMVDILKEADLKKKAQGGRKNKLTIENQLLMALEYLREYHIFSYRTKLWYIGDIAQ